MYSPAEVDVINKEPVSIGECLDQNTIYPLKRTTVSCPLTSLNQPGQPL